MATKKQKPSEKMWSECIELWNAESVPEVDVVPYDYKRPTSSPWRNRDNVHACSSNPLKSTAYHLSVYLLDKPAELAIAYKLHAFCVQYEQHPDSLLRYAFSINGSELWGWWGQNSRNVLPPVKGSTIRELQSRELQDWKELIPVAANEWRMINEQWLIVRVPDLMLDGSDEQASWGKYCEETIERRERAEYERLKRRFEST